METWSSFFSLKGGEHDIFPGMASLVRVEYERTDLPDRSPARHIQIANLRNPKEAIRGQTMRYDGDVIFKKTRESSLMPKDGNHYKVIWCRCSHCSSTYAEICKDFHYCPGCGGKIILKN